MKYIKCAVTWGSGLLFSLNVCAAEPIFNCSMIDQSRQMRRSKEIVLPTDGPHSFSILDSNQALLINA